MDTKKHKHVQSRDWPMWEVESLGPEQMQPRRPAFGERQKEHLSSGPACNLHWVLCVSHTAQPLCPGHSPQENEMRHQCWVVAC